MVLKSGQLWIVLRETVSIGYVENFTLRLLISYVIEFQEREFNFKVYLSIKYSMCLSTAAYM